MRLAITVLALSVFPLNALGQVAFTPWDVQQACARIKTTPFSQAQTLTVKTKTKTISFSVEIADSDAERSQGLMCRQELGDKNGMLFVFSGMAERNFWMKNTLIGLDILYIDQHGKIISIQRNARPLDETPLPSFGKAKAVLEINAGYADRFGIKVGDKIKHPAFK